MHEACGRLFAAVGNVFYEIDSAGTATNRGTLSTSTGPVSIADNELQVVAVAFDAAGKVIDIGSGYVPFEYLNAGQDAPFQFMLRNTKTAPAKYQMLAEGHLTE